MGRTSGLPFLLQQEAQKVWWSQRTISTANLLDGLCLVCALDHYVVGNTSMDIWAAATF